MRRLLPVAIAATTLVVLPVALQAEDDEEGETDIDRTVTVEATDYDFEPATIETTTSTTLQVVFTNEGNVSHSWAIPELGVVLEPIQPGESTSVTFRPDEPGSYEIVCQVPGHEQIGMTGTLIVESTEPIDKSR